MIKQSYFHSEDNHRKKKMNRQPTDWEKILG